MFLGGTFFAYMANSYLNQNQQVELEGKTKDYEIDFASELKDGEMRALKFGDKDYEKVLIIRHNGEIIAYSNFCTHFGAPLDTGILL